MQYILAEPYWDAEQRIGYTMMQRLTTLAEEGWIVHTINRKEIVVARGYPPMDEVQYSEWALMEKDDEL